ncbi:MAG: hypothetical protein Q6365_022235 [Candidatus Sigynarchaeota archaeon]
MASTKSRHASRPAPIKVVGDARFYKPGIDIQYDVETTNLTPTTDDYTNLAYRTNAGNRIVFGVADDVCRGRFTSDKVDDTALVPFFEEFWGNDSSQGFPKQLAEMRMHGIGFAIATHPNETSEDFINPIRHQPGEPLAWIVPETANMFQSTTIKSPPHVDPLSWADQWKWWNVPIHKSRIEVLQFYPDEANVLGHSELEKCTTVLFALYNMERGALDRISAWSLLTYILRIDPSSFKINDKSKYDALAALLGQSTLKPLESSDDIVQLTDGTQGTELAEILYTLLSTGTRIPAAILKGVQQGAVTGSEVDLTQYGQLLTSIQARATPYIRRILKRWYGLDVDDLKWNVDFFQSKKTELELRKLEIEVERMEKGEDEAFLRAQFSRRAIEISREPGNPGNLIEKGEVPQP